MPRGRRRTRDTGGALSSLQQADQVIYGSQDMPPEILELDSRRRAAKPVSIFDIYPDRSQPRRAIPSAVRAYWNGTPETVSQLFAGWLEEIQKSGRPDFDLSEYLNQTHLPEGVEGNEDDVDHPLASGDYMPLQRSLLGLADLAISIRHSGLMNPITVAKQGRSYQLETGERRWLAYHLLHMDDPEGGWDKIPAYAVEEVSVWRQASENHARADLNAIGKARQLAILLIDLLSTEGENFATFDEILEAGYSEREYYAQVADGQQYRVPRGEGERLLNAMGLKNPTQIRQYRQLLRLPDDIWQQADDEDWPESKLRKFHTVTTVTVSSTDISDRTANPFVEQTNKRRRTRVWNYANRLENLSDAEREKALAEIEADERWLSELKQAIARR